MGFQGQLSSVNLTDIFQTLNMNRQTGTLSVTGPAVVVHIYFDQGNITMATAPAVNGKPYLLDALAHKGQISSDKVDDIIRQSQSSGHSLRDLILASGMVADYELDEISAWAIEELVCPVFEWREGDFTFSDGPPVPELLTMDAVVMGGVVVQTTQLVMEATRRMDEWKRIREIITDADAFYIVDNDGRANLKNVQTDPDMLKVLRYLDGRHTLDSIAQAVGVTRFDTFAIVAQLALAGVARPRVVQEVVEDAVSLIQQGDVPQARDLLEICLKQAPMPEVMRPLAECCVQLNQAPRAVELYLELIQMGQDQGDLATSLKDLDTVISLSPDDPDLHFERGQVQSELGQVELAATSYSTAAQAYLARKDLPRAIDACHRAKNLLPRAPEPHRYLARAYLLEGQTENAVVEYKSLWHALLTAERPKVALETLQGILDADCKYNNVKEQVLSHAQNSEAIKTSKATRILVYVLILLVIAGSGVFAYEYYQGTVVKREGIQAVNEFEATMSKGMAVLDHATLLTQLSALRDHYGANPDVVRRLDNFQNQITNDFNFRATAQYNHAQELKNRGLYEDAEAAINELKQRYYGTTAATMADTLREAIRGERVGSQVAEKIKEADNLWTNLQWDEASAVLDTILARKDLPGPLRDTLAKKHVDWAADIRSAERLYARAKHIEDTGSKQEALAAYRRASTGEGQQWVDRSRARVLAIELDLAHDLGRLAQVAAQRGDDQQAFTCIDQLTTLTKDASSREVSDYVTNLELPFTLQLDSPHVQVTVHRPGASDEHIIAPVGKRSGWVQTLTYRVGETLSIDATRPGFIPQNIQVGIQKRKTQTPVVLVRGPKWRIDLSGMATTRPVVARQLVLVGTDKASIEMVDPVLGADRPWHLDSHFTNLSEFQVPPTVYQDHTYFVLAEHVFSVDLGTRSAAWHYPASENEGLRFSGYLWVQDHDIKSGSLLVVAPVIKGGFQLLEVDGSGGVKEYPRTAPESDVTGAPLVDHPSPGVSLLYIPASNGLDVYDISSVTGDSAPHLLYHIDSRGDLVGKPIKARVGNRDAILISDRSGSVLAFDADPNAADSKRILMSWVLNGTDPSTPVCVPGRFVAYVGVSEGRVFALDLAQTGQPLWQFPPTGQLGPMPGQPVLSPHGVYVGDAKGILHCIDAKTGAERWHAECGSPVVGGILANDGRIFAPTKNGQLVCFEEGDE